MEVTEIDPTMAQMYADMEVLVRKWRAQGIHSGTIAARILMMGLGACEHCGISQVAVHSKVAAWYATPTAPVAKGNA